MYKDTCGGGKGSGSSYDPQIAQASASAAATASKAEQFSETYYNNVITPLLKQQSAASADSQEKLGKLYDINADQMQLANDRYKQYGIPAENRYYDMVARYSEPEEFERQAEAAKGDFATAQQAEQGTLNRQMSAMGIDPTSPAAVAAASDRAVMGAAMQANAMNRARSAARTLGMQLTSDAANFGRGGQSGILQFGAGAQGNATGAFGIANAALGTGMQAGAGVTQGYQTALSGYNGIMDSYSRLGAADIQAQAQQGGIGSLIGTLGGAALSNPAIGAAMFSDRRLKLHVQKVGELPSGTGVYEFDYVWGGHHIGVIAQELRHTNPDAVSVDDSGYLMVDYDKVRLHG